MRRKEAERGLRKEIRMGKGRVINRGWYKRNIKRTNFNEL